MEEILSQSEIDELINTIAVGEETITDVSEKTSQTVPKEYSFRRPDKFTKDQIRTLYMINEIFAKLVSNFLSGYLRSMVSIKIVSIEQITYEDFLVSIPSPTLLTIFHMAPLNGSAVMEFNHNFSFPIIDLLFGGIGRKTKKVRQLTEIELSVLKKVNQKILENMALAWEDVLKIDPVIEALETNPQLSQIVSPNETIALVTFSADIRDNHSLINLCLPYVTLKEELSSLTTQHWFATREDKDISKEKETIIKNRLNKVVLNLSACCGETSLTVRDILGLGEGDVILLDKKVGNDMELLVEGHPKYRVQPGVTDNRLAVLVTGKL